MQPVAAVMNGLKGGVRRLRAALRERVLTLGGRRVFFDPAAFIGDRWPHWRAGGWRDLTVVPLLTAPLTRKSAGSGRYLDLTLALDLPWAETARYNYCSLEMHFGDDATLPHGHAITLRLHHLRHLHTVRVVLPEMVRAATHVRFALRPAPQCTEGKYRLIVMRLTDSEEPAALTRAAQLEDLKERVRLYVPEAERTHTEVCAHYPTALCFEMTARCNLTCVHCSSHGAPEVHRTNNKIAEFPLAQLEALASEVFPSLTVISLVGRGEPLLLDEALWRRFVELMIEHRVMFTVTTNGYFLERRLTPELMPFVDSINVSMDGLTPETFAANRGGADVDRVWRNIAYFDRLRKAAGLARRPRLSFAWTLKQNNVAELPAFVRKIAEYDADSLTVRHLMMFFPSQASQSVLAIPGDANVHLREAYELLEHYGIQRDCVPLIGKPREELVTLSTGAQPARARPQRDPCMFMHRMPVIHCTGAVHTCAVPGAALAGQLGQAASFGEIWNGPVFRGVRAALDTDHEWEQCRTCWYREGRFATQRDLAASGKRYEADEEAPISPQSLNFLRR